MNNRPAFFKRPEDNSLVASVQHAMSGNNIVDLSGLYFDNSTLREVSEMLKDNTSVTSLDLSENTFDDEGIKYLVDAIAHNNTLQELRLSRNPGVTKEGLNQLGRVFSIKPKFHYLEVNGTVYQKPRVTEADLIEYQVQRMKF